MLIKPAARERRATRGSYVAAAFLLSLLLPAPGSPADAADPMERYFCEDAHRDFFAKDLLAQGELAPQRFPTTAISFKLPKPPGISRVFLVGESAATILGSRKASGGAGLEIVNCGMGGYESSRILRVAEEVVNYSPDLLVVFSGNNEGESEPCTGLSSEVRRRERKLLERWYSLRNGAERGARLAVLKQFEKHLREIARLSRKKGVPLVLCRLPSNIRDIPPDGRPPYASVYFLEGQKELRAGRPKAAFEKFKLSIRDYPSEPFAYFYAGKALYASGRPAEAAAYFLAALELDPRTSRSTRELKDIVSKVAREEGACVAELDSVLNGLSSGAPGFREFIDPVHWVDSLNGAVLREILRAGTECGYQAPPGAAGLEIPAAHGPEEDDARRLSYSVSWISAAREGFSEPALAELGFLFDKNSMLLQSALTSPRALNNRLISNFWLKPGTGSGSRLYPALLAHSAESVIRSGRPGKGLELSEKGLLLAPGMRSLQFARAHALAEKKSDTLAREAFCSLAAAGGEWSISAALASDYGYKRCPPGTAGSLPGGTEQSSRELSDSAVNLMTSRPSGETETLLRRAIAADPYNAEALITLCTVLEKTGREAEAAAECGKAAEASVAFDDSRSPALRDLARNAYSARASLLARLGRTAEAAESRRRAAALAPEPAGAGAPGGSRK